MSQDVEIVKAVITTVASKMGSRLERLGLESLGTGGKPRGDQ